MTAMLHIMMMMMMLHACSASAINTTSPATFCAGKPNGVYGNPLSCSSFWTCWANGLHGSLLLCPPNTLWHPASLSCAPPPPASATPPPPYLSPSLNYSSSASNSSSSIPASAAPGSSQHSPFCVQKNTHALPNLHNLPIWRWDGTLHCYGYGCSDLHSTQTRNLHSQFDIGVPCAAAEELISIARRSKEAWMPAPHEFAEGDARMGRGGQHWKVRFDGLKGGRGSTLMKVLRASIKEYSPAERVVGAWQGGAMKEAVKFSLTGPRASPGRTSKCYYSIAMESPHLTALWTTFTRDLLNQTKASIDQMPPTTLNNMGDQNISKRGVHTMPDANLVQVGDLFRKGSTGPLHTIQGCLENVPWANLVASVLCYASNIEGGFQSLSLCSSDLSSSELITIASCFTSLFGIISE